MTTTAKNEIKTLRDKTAAEIRRMDQISETRDLTYAERKDQDTRIGWERALSWSLTVIDAEENGTLDTLIRITGGN